MNKTFWIEVKQPWKADGYYRLEIGKHELDVDQTCIDRLRELIDDWTVDFDEGRVTACGKLERIRPPHTCYKCGTKLHDIRRTWCEGCWSEISREMRGKVAA